jgi:hypothetical protein
MLETISSFRLHGSVALVVASLAALLPVVACGDSGANAGGAGSSATSVGGTGPSVSTTVGVTSPTSTAAQTGAGGANPGRDFSTDRTKFFGDSRCAQANVQLCEDFESGTLDTSTWTVNGNAPVIDGVQHARGNKALHITKMGNGASYIKETKTFPAVDHTYYGRMFAYFNSLPSNPGMTYAHWTFIAASGTGANGEIRLSGQLSNGKNLFGVGTDTGTNPNGSGDWTNSDKDPNGNPLAVPTGQWLCIEWEHSTKTNETHFWWDATEHPSLDTTATMHGGNANPYDLPEFTNVWLGWQEYQASTENFEMWIDEIAIDKDRIGCVL